jgi:hypothetical protein
MRGERTLFALLVSVGHIDSPMLMLCHRNGKNYVFGLATRGLNCLLLMLKA